jgi:protein-tyrosine phosphatase
MEERRFLLANLATICISIEGGPATADELARATRSAGRIIIPVARTGGASGGMFGAPSMSRPTGIVDEITWALLHDEMAPIEDTAQAVVSIIISALSSLKSEKPTSSAKASLEEATDTTYVEPALAGCAHLVFQGADHHTTSDDDDDDDDDSSGSVVLFGDIYLGPEEAASEAANPYLDAVKIGGIVNCTNRCPNRFQSSKKYCTVAVNDENGADILTYLPGATLFIHALVSNGVNVLVHCQRGISRSATVVIAYLIRYGRMTRDDAFRHVESRRPIVCPNRGFWEQLQRFEDEVEKSKGRQGAEPASSTVPPDISGRRELMVDIDWAQKCSAVFSTCHQIPEIFQSEEITNGLSEATRREAQEQILTVCLDFVWGRGVLDVDL